MIANSVPSRKYVIVYSPSSLNIMHLRGIHLSSPLALVAKLIGIDTSNINRSNFTDFLNFDPTLIRIGLADALGTQTPAAEYIGNQIARLRPQYEIVHADDRMRSLKNAILERSSLPLAVFVTSLSATFPAAACKSIVLNHACIPVFIGGIHVSVSTSDIDIHIRAYCKHPGLVSSVVGAGDSIVLSEILSDLENHSQKTHYFGTQLLEDGVWKPQANVTYIRPQRVTANLALPRLWNWFIKHVRVIPIAPFAGCMNSCRFCSIYSLPKRYRKLSFRTTNDILSEIRFHELNPDSRNTFYLLTADNLLVGGHHLEALLDVLTSSRMSHQFIAQLPIEVAFKPKLLEKLRLAGASSFLIGLESLDLRNLQFIRKPIARVIESSGQSVTTFFSDAIKRIQDRGIAVHASFIFGLPFDYFHSMDRNSGTDVADFCINHHISVQACSYVSLPGSADFAEAKALKTRSEATVDELISLSLTDLSESNLIQSRELKQHPIRAFYMTFECLNRVGMSRPVSRAALFMMARALNSPTAHGRSSVLHRIGETLSTGLLQAIAGVYREVGLRVASSTRESQGVLERLFMEEQDAHVRFEFEEYVRSYSNSFSALTRGDG